MGICSRKDSLRVREFCGCAAAGQEEATESEIAKLDAPKDEDINAIHCTFINNAGVEIELWWDEQKLQVQGMAHPLSAFVVKSSCERCVCVYRWPFHAAVA